MQSTGFEYENKLNESKRLIKAFTLSDELVNQRAKQIYEVDQSIELSVRMKLKKSIYISKTRVMNIDLDNFNVNERVQNTMWAV